jgi:hypothetical protein
MAKPLSQFLQDSKGNWDEQALLSMVGVSTFLGLTIYSVVVLHQHFDFEAFGIGFGSTMGATLIGMAYRESRGGQNAGISEQPGS